MTTVDFAKRLIAMIPADKINELLDLSSEVSRPLQREIAKHVHQVAKDSILAKTEVHDDTLI